jgi:hypothetical protein
MIFTGVGLLAVISGNVFTLLLSWILLDLLELFQRIFSIKRPEPVERTIVAFSVKIFTILMMMFAVTISWQNPNGNFQGSVYPWVATLIVLAAGVRLGLIPYQKPLDIRHDLPQSKNLLLLLIPSTATFVLLARMNSGVFPPIAFNLLFFFFIIGTIFAAITWIASRDQLQGISYWVLAGGGMVLISTLVNEPNATLAWGLGIVLSGCIIFLYRRGLRLFVIFPILGWLSFSALPYTQTWPGILTFSSSLFFSLDNWRRLILIIPHSVLMTGYIKITTTSLETRDKERWKKLILILALTLLVVSQGIIAWTCIRYSNSELDDLSWIEKLSPGLISLLLVGALLGLSRIHVLFPRIITSRATDLFSFIWLYKIIWKLYQLISRFVGFVDSLFDGEGGLIWTLLILVLFLSLLFQIRFIG